MRSHKVCIYIIYGRTTTKYAVIYGVYIHYIWQNNHQICGHIRCVYTVFLAGKSPNIRSDTVCIYINMAENHQICSHIWCV